ncbi:hypothetical protein [Streptomyces sp. NPDC052042]|uniref:hypothetical protein n=1 Tax=Streptomyces sp. NPDC052042 TaxID=3365683 RepID=UPI0037D49BAE
MSSDKLRARLRAATLLALAPVMAACAWELENIEGSRNPSVSEVTGTWHAADGRTAEFEKNGTVTLTNITCNEVTPSSTEIPDEPLRGTWSVRFPRMGGSRVIALEFPAGVCGKGGIGSLFYIYQQPGDLILHLRDPDMYKKDLDFTKASP